MYAKTAAEQPATILSFLCKVPAPISMVDTTDGKIQSKQIEKKKKCRDQKCVRGLTR